MGWITTFIYFMVLIFLYWTITVLLRMLGIFDLFSFIEVWQDIFSRPEPTPAPPPKRTEHLPEDSIDLRKEL